MTIGRPLALPATEDRSQVFVRLSAGFVLVAEGFCQELIAGKLFRDSPARACCLIWRAAQCLGVLFGRGGLEGAGAGCGEVGLRYSGRPGGCKLTGDGKCLPVILLFLLHPVGLCGSELVLLLQRLLMLLHEGVACCCSCRCVWLHMLLLLRLLLLLWLVAC